MTQSEEPNSPEALPSAPPLVSSGAGMALRSLPNPDKDVRTLYFNLRQSQAEGYAWGRDMNFDEVVCFNGAHFSKKDLEQLVNTNVPGSWGNERLQFQGEMWTQPIPIWRSLQYVKSLAHCEISTHWSDCDYNLDFLQTWKLWMQCQFMQYQLPRKPAILTFYKKMFYQGIHSFNGRRGLLSFERPLCPSPWDEYVIHAAC